MGRSALSFRVFALFELLRKTLVSIRKCAIDYRCTEHCGGSNVKLGPFGMWLIVVLSERCALDVEHDWCHVREFGRYGHVGRVLDGVWYQWWWCIRDSAIQGLSGSTSSGFRLSALLVRSLHLIKTYSFYLISTFPIPATKDDPT